MITRARFLWIVTALLSTLNGGCGTSGSRPTLYPEVNFHVQPVPEPGPVTFTVDELVAGGVQHTFPPDMTFTGTSSFDFYFENAPPPYSGTFTVTGGGNVAVTLTVTGQKSVGPLETSDGEPLVVESGSLTPGITPGPPRQEIRFDVCVPSVTAGTCFTSGDAGIPGLFFSGSISDASITHSLVLNAVTRALPTTPSIYFLEGAQDSVNAVFRLAVVTGQTLVVQLFIDGALEETGSSATSDGVHIRRDL